MYTYLQLQFTGILLEVREQEVLREPTLTCFASDAYSHPQYIEAIWNVINFKEAARRFKEASAGLQLTGSKVTYHCNDCLLDINALTIPREEARN